MLRRMLAATVLSLLSGCTFVYITGDANSIAESSNHSGTLSVPEAKTTHVGLPRPDGL